MNHRRSQSSSASRVWELERQICTAEPEKGLEVGLLETMLCVCFTEAAFCRKDFEVAIWEGSCRAIGGT